MSERWLVIPAEVVPRMLAAQRGLVHQVQPMPLEDGTYAVNSGIKSAAGTIYGPALVALTSGDEQGPAPLTVEQLLAWPELDELPSPFVQVRAD